MNKCPYCGAEYSDGVAECATDHAQLVTPAREDCLSSRGPIAGKISIGVGIIGNGILVLSCLPFFAIPRGTGIRPMSWAMLVAFIAVCTLAVGLPSALISFRSSRRRVSITALVLSITPWPLAVLLLRAIAAVCGLEIEP